MNTIIMTVSVDVAVDTTMRDTNTIKTMSITTMANAAVDTTMRDTNIIMTTSMSITTTRMAYAVVDITMITTITIIMQMKSLLHGEKRLHVNTAKRNWNIF